MDGERTFYPVFLDLRGKRCVVVGGGRVGERKVRGLLAAGACVRVVSPEVACGLAQLAAEGRLELVRRVYRAGDLDGAALAFAATDRPGVNRAVAREAGARGVPLNGADGSGDFILPSSFCRGRLQVAVSTGGGSPAFARLVRRQMEAALGPEYGAMAGFLAGLRARVMDRFPDDEARRGAVWKRLASQEVLDLIRKERWERIEEMVSECLS